MKIIQLSILSLLGISTALHVSAQTTREQIDSILSRPAVVTNTWTIQVQNESGTVTYYERNATVGRTPASTTKLFAVAGAFGLLGTNHYFETRIYCNGALANGTLTGNLNLVSEHDITWNEQTFGAGNSRIALDHIAAKLKSQGLTNVSGNVQCYGVCYYNRPSSDNTHNSQSQSVYNQETAVALVAALQAQGISVSGGALGQLGFNPPGTLFYTHKSSDLTYGGMPLVLDVVCIPLSKSSHNVMADGLLRHIGYKVRNSDTFGGGSAAIFNWLQNVAGISTNGMVMNDGAGLYSANRFSAQQFNRLTRYMLGVFSSWARILGTGCVDGGLKNRFCNTDGANTVHAKNGSLTSVVSSSVSLCGYIDNKYSGRRFLFSFVANGSPGINQSATRQAIDDCVVLFGTTNAPLSLAPIPGKTVRVLQPLVFTNFVTTVEPGLTLTYSLDSEAPEGASIDPVTGVFAWTPSAGQGPATYNITVRATDSNVPALSDTRTFSVIVNKTVQAPIVWSFGSQLRLQFSTDPGVGYTIETTTNLVNPVNWQTILITNASSTSIDFIPTASANESQHFYRVLSH